jgi:hypothetical protein
MREHAVAGFSAGLNEDLICVPSLDCVLEELKLDSISLFSRSRSRTSLVTAWMVVLAYGGR